MSRKGSKIAFISDPPKEGFQAVVEIDGDPYTVRIYGVLRDAPTEAPVRYRGTTRNWTRPIKESTQQKFRETEERRIWRVLYYHLKSVFEAADSGVMEFRELMLPYIVTKSGKTIAECIVPELSHAININPSRLLEGGK
jgi:hypothetical protein